MDSVNNQTQPSMLSSLWAGAKATVGSFFSGLSPTTWFGAKTTSFIGNFVRDGLKYAAMGEPCAAFVPVETVPTPEYGKGYHFDAEPMSKETAASAMRYAASIQTTTSSVIAGINPLNLAHINSPGNDTPQPPVSNGDDFKYVACTQIPGQAPIYTGNNADLDIDALNEVLGGNLIQTTEKGVNYYVDLESGLAFTALQDFHTKEIVISFPGLGGGQNIPGIKGDTQRVEDFGNAQLSAVTKQLAGDVPLCYQQAAAVVSQIKENNPDTPVATAGFSFGGSVAQYAALKHEAEHPGDDNPVKAHCFNGLAIGAGLQRDIGDATLDQADALITHYGTEGDWVTDLTGIKTLDKILGFLGFRTPGNYGKKYVLPPAGPKQSLFERHVGIIHNMLNRAGWMKPADVAAD